MPKIDPNKVAQLKLYKTATDFWFWALRSLTGEDTVTKAIRGDVVAMREA